VQQFFIKRIACLTQKLLGPKLAQGLEVLLVREDKKSSVCGKTIEILQLQTYNKYIRNGPANFFGVNTF
jgi:hypothetical protein